MASKKTKDLVASLSLEELKANVSLLGEEPEEGAEELVKQLTKLLPKGEYTLEEVTDSLLETTPLLGEAGFVSGEKFLVSGVQAGGSGEEDAEPAQAPKFIGSLVVLSESKKVVNGLEMVEVRTSDGATRLYEPEYYKLVVSHAQAPVPEKGV